MTRRGSETRADGGRCYRLESGLPVPCEPWEWAAWIRRVGARELTVDWTESGDLLVVTAFCGRRPALAAGGRVLLYRTRVLDGPAKLVGLEAWSATRAEAQREHGRMVDRARAAEGARR